MSHLSITHDSTGMELSETRTAARSKHRTENIDHYFSDVVRCPKEVKLNAGVKYPQGGLRFNPDGAASYGTLEINVGVDSERYQRCMTGAGWDIQMITDLTGTVYKVSR